MLKLSDPKAAEAGACQEKDVDPFDGDADQETEKSGATCRVCGKGRMIRGLEIPRPTVAQIMSMPHPWQPVRAVGSPTDRPPPAPRQLPLPIKLHALEWY